MIYLIKSFLMGLGVLIGGLCFLFGTVFFLIACGPMLIDAGYVKIGVAYMVTEFVIILTYLGSNAID